MGLRAYGKYGSAGDKLSQAIRTGRISHAYIIEGDHNVDKLGFAMEFVKALLCPEDPGEGCGLCSTCRRVENGNYEDLYLVQPDRDDKKATLSIKDADIEELQANLKMKPTGGDRNIAIIDGCDGMTPRAQNRFLKTLEEPAPGTVILLLSENMENLLPTIRSRCVHYRLNTPADAGELPMLQLAEDLLDMVWRNEFFYDMKERLDQEITDRKSAYAFLDAMETAMGNALRKGNSTSGDDYLIYGVQWIEKTRANIRRNVGFKYAIRYLILKLEEYKW